MPANKNAIALLITIMFVIVITIAIGYGLKQVNIATSKVKTEKFMYQSSILIEDVLKILNDNKDLKTIAKSRSSTAMFLFLSQAAFIPFESSGVEILLSIKSARSKFNINDLNTSSIDSLKYYFESFGINNAYVDLLLDNENGIKVDNSYNSNIFDENPYLFRNYISSIKHLDKINDFYKKEYHDNNLKKINFNNLFYFTKATGTYIDLNYATSEVWQMMLSTDKQRAEQLKNAEGSYKTMADLNLNFDEQVKLSQFKTSFFEPFVLVDIQITQNKSKSKISFEYDIKNNKGSNFVYEI